MNINNPPNSYKPAKSMTIGTNQLNNVGIIISFNGHCPIFIGDGNKPHVWINVPANKEASEWYPLVKDNFSTNSSIQVFDDGRQVKVTTPEAVILDCEKLPNGTIKVSEIDLRVLGLSFQANSNEISVMNQKFSNNTFSDVGVMFNIGK